MSTVVGGFSDNAQLEEVAHVESFAPLSGDEWAQIRAAYAANFHLDDSAA